MSNFMCKPNLIVYLDVTPERSMERIRARGREVENEISLEYLTALYQGYQDFVTEISRVIPVIRVDYDRFPTTEEMARVIMREHLDHNYLREVARFDPTR
jgi:deoxyadenosine kinase